MNRSTSYDVVALSIMLSDSPEGVRQARLAALARQARREIHNEVACPACGHEGPHDDNGAATRAQLSYCCCACGEHFDAEGV